MLEFESDIIDEFLKLESSIYVELLKLESDIVELSAILKTLLCIAQLSATAKVTCFKILDFPFFKFKDN